MQRRLAVLLGAFVVLGVFAFVRPAAEAHTCDSKGENCEETPVMDSWRDAYVPLFDLEDREDESQRYDAQRWRDECNNGDQYRQQCAWFYGGNSVFPPGDPDAAPNEYHAGYAASHCFLAEAQHQCEDHVEGEGAHDAHGGALYADVCLTANPESKYCDDGMTDTQAGVTIMDHNGCGVVVPIAACTDEYHVVRPFDGDYTAAQMENTQEATALIVSDPARYLCGTHTSGQNCRNAVNSLIGAVTGLLP